MYYLEEEKFGLRIKLSKRTKVGKDFKRLIEHGKSYKDLKLCILSIVLKYVDIYTFLERYNAKKEELIEFGKKEKLREIGDAFQIESFLKKIV